MPLTDVRSLYQLQLLDLEIDSLSQELAGIQARIGETDELINARQVLDDGRRALQDFQSTLQDRQFEAERITTKLGAEERRLYQGQVHNPKELESLRREVELLKRQRREIEDRELDLMAEIEETQRGVDAAAAELKRVSAEWEVQQQDLAARQTEITARLAALRKKRHSAAAVQPASTLATYEDLRRTGRGRAVAVVERSTCQGCRVAIPSSIAHRARGGHEIVHCPSCSRILFFER